VDWISYNQIVTYLVSHRAESASEFHRALSNLLKKQKIPETLGDIMISTAEHLINEGIIKGRIEGEARGKLEGKLESAKKHRKILKHSFRENSSRSRNYSKRSRKARYQLK